MVIVVFFEMLRATFLARFFTMKLPKPRRYTLFLGERRLDALHESLDDSLHLHLLNAGAFSDFAYDICLCHVYIVFKIKFIQNDSECKYTLYLHIRQ